MPINRCTTYKECKRGVCLIFDIKKWPKPKDQTNWEKGYVEDFKGHGITLEEGAIFGVC